MTVLPSREKKKGEKKKKKKKTPITKRKTAQVYGSFESSPVLKLHKKVDISSESTKGLLSWTTYLE